jgi:ribosomal protein S18 acetylase RimI-like enzyme
MRFPIASHLLRNKKDPRSFPVVGARFRRLGISRHLIDQAIAWTKDRKLPGIMLETQDINVNVAACRLYEDCGFLLGGFDRFLYRAALPGAEEVALYWYLIFADQDGEY